MNKKEAIKRIKDIAHFNQVDHLERDEDLNESGFNLIARRQLRMEGAVLELMAIFDIKEDDLKD